MEEIEKKTFIGKDGYVEYIQGNLPIVIAVPHGGRLKPHNIPNRQSGVIDGDTSTIELGVELFSFLSYACSTKTKAKIPHLIIFHLHRVKLDANRTLEEASGSLEASEAWHQYHDFINIAKSKVIKKYKRGHFYDIHGNKMSWKGLIF